MATFITANGLMVTWVDFDKGGIDIRVRAHMLDYLDRYKLNKAVFKIGHAEVELSREDILAD